jgi:hypothetical protein
MHSPQLPALQVFVPLLLQMVPQLPRHAPHAKQPAVTVPSVTPAGNLNAHRLTQSAPHQPESGHLAEQASQKRHCINLM